MVRHAMVRIERKSEIRYKLADFLQGDQAIFVQTGLDCRKTRTYLIQPLANEQRQHVGFFKTGDHPYRDYFPFGTSVRRNDDAPGATVPIGCFRGSCKSGSPQRSGESPLRDGHARAGK